MGVPAFFRWLSNCSNKIVSDIEAGQDLQDRIDNLYLDMNGIIHPCTHPPPGMGIPDPKNEKQMFDNIAK